VQKWLNEIHLGRGLWWVHGSMH